MNEERSAESKEQRVKRGRQENSKARK